MRAHRKPKTLGYFTLRAKRCSRPAGPPAGRPRGSQGVNLKTNPYPTFEPETGPWLVVPYSAPFCANRPALGNIPSLPLKRCSTSYREPDVDMLKIVPQPSSQAARPPLYVVPYNVDPTSTKEFVGEVPSKPPANECRTVSI